MQLIYHMVDDRVNEAITILGTFSLYQDTRFILYTDHQFYRSLVNDREKEATANLYNT